ncbi:MAG: fumarate hydratase [Methanotrichaceae archaeon]|nr:fumarate hydratase [Methanotrichaceae archaeon]
MKRNEVVEATVRALKRAETFLPSWVSKLIEQAAERETNSVARSHLLFMLENVHIAQRKGLPLCQDTGLPIFYIELGQDVKLEFDLKAAVADGVRKATRDVPLRPNVVDPLTRENTNDNTGRCVPDIILSNDFGDELRITAFPKGAGSENMSLVEMLNPADDPIKFILNIVAERANNSCPPLFLGIGIGGSFDLAARMSKRALLNMPGTSDLELRLLERINSLGIGPMGLGGDTTVLGVKIEKASCHTASLPVAINFQCWANRSATEVLK